MRSGESRHEVGPAAVRRTLLELLPSDTSSSRRPPAPTGDEVQRAWNEAEHHLEVARRLGEDVPSREDILEAPEAWARAPGGVPAAAASRRAAGSAVRLLPAGEDRPRPRTGCGRCSAARRRRSSCATTRASSSGSRSCWRRADAASRATLAIGALDGGFVMPSLRVLTDHEIFRRARRLRRPAPLPAGRPVGRDRER